MPRLALTVRLNTGSPWRLSKTLKTSVVAPPMSTHNNVWPVVSA